MKITKFFSAAAAVLAIAALMTSCEEPVQNLGAPKLTLDTDELTFDAKGGDQTLTLNATRDWIVDDYKADWVVVSPDNGEASADDQVITVTVLENKEMDREIDIVFTIGMAERTLTVKQAGPGGSAEQLIIYYNNYDKEEATNTFGSGTSWPYLDQFEGWKNQTGTGSANVEYAFKGMSARANSTSNSNYSDYEGSGVNNMFFGSSAYLATKNIALNGTTNIEMTFGTEKYSQDNGSVFKPSEFHVYLSNDGAKWVELTDYTFAGGTTEGRWNVASAKFTVPSGTSNLSVCMKADVASSYRMDDLKLVVASEAGTAVDFSKAVEMDFGAGSTGGGNTGGGNTDYSNAEAKTVEQFIAAADKSTYFKLTGTVSGFNSTYCSFDLTDATGKIYVYSVANKADWTDKIKNGGTVVLAGKYDYYDQKSQHEVVNAYIISFEEGEKVDYSKAEAKTVEQFIAAADNNTYYKLTGTASNFNSQYSSFDLTDETGTIYVYSVANKAEWSGKIGNGSKVVLAGKYLYYEKETKHEVVDAVILSSEGGEIGGGEVTPPAGDPGQYDPQGITWTLGSSAYDNTSSGNSAQKATVNGVAVNNLLKLGTGSKVGDATLHIPAGTKKVGAYVVAWKGKTAELKFSVGGTEVGKLTPKANDGATGNPPYTITVADSDYYELDVPTTEAVDVKIETTDPANGRVIIIGLKAIK